MELSRLRAITANDREKNSRDVVKIQSRLKTEKENYKVQLQVQNIAYGASSAWRKIECDKLDETANTARLRAIHAFTRVVLTLSKTQISALNTRSI